MQQPGIKAPNSYRLAPVGQCIYCGATGVRLDKEHVIPEGMGGTLILQEASCVPCARITSLFERKVMQGFLDHGRRALGVKGKKKHKKKLALTVTQTLLGHGDTTSEVELPFEQAWRVMSFPLLTLPRIMDPDKDLTDEEGVDLLGTDTIHFGTERLQRGHIGAARGARIEDRIDVISFVRLLAKIAHSYHVAINGLFPLHESPLIPIILGERMDAKNWIGGMEEHPLPSDRPALHLIAEDPMFGDDGSRSVAVRIKLFAPHQTPTYVAMTRIMPPAVDAAGSPNP